MKGLTVVSIFILLCSTFAAVRLVLADTPPQSEIEGKKQIALTFLEKIMNLNVSAYDLDYSYKYTSEMYGYDQIWDFYVNLRRGDESVTTDFMFIHGYMTEFRCNSTAPLSIKQGKTVLSVARQVLEAYMTNFNASYCSLFIQSLDQVTPDQNQTIRIRDLILYVNSNGQDLTWAYSPNGIRCQKGFALHIPNEEHTIGLVDYWDIYRIGSTEINLTQEQAIDTAFPLILQYAQEKKRLITSLEAELRYDRDWDGSRGDIYIIYPEWRVYANFLDSINDPWVVGYSVGVWADTGQVFRSIPQCIIAEPTSQPPSYLQAITIAVIVMPFASLLFIVYGKNRGKSNLKLPL